MLMGVRVCRLMMEDIGSGDSVTCGRDMARDLLVGDNYGKVICFNRSAVGAAAYREARYFPV
jgi:hypothetical protein